MPNAVVISYAHKSGKTVADVEKIWNTARSKALSKFGSEKNVRFWSYVNGTVEKILGIKENVKRLTFKEFLMEGVSKPDYE